MAGGGMGLVFGLSAGVCWLMYERRAGRKPQVHHARAVRLGRVGSGRARTGPVDEAAEVSMSLVGSDGHAEQAASEADGLVVGGRV
jgi:hypothetical protein